MLVISRQKQYQWVAKVVTYAQQKGCFWSILLVHVQSVTVSAAIASM